MKDTKKIIIGTICVISVFPYIMQFHLLDSSFHSVVLLFTIDLKLTALYLKSSVFSLEKSNFTSVMV